MPTHEQLRSAPPPQVDGYDHLEPLGGGGMGVVYKARQQSLNRWVALKVIRPDRVGDEITVERFRREARAAARLRHPNIVPVFDFVQQGELHFLVMEYVAGETLDQRVSRRGRLPVPEACECVRQAALGLQHALEQGLVHRDIKPANLIREETSGTIKVLDLGLARADATGNESNFTLTQERTVLGTADFIAPEQIENCHGVDIRADLYSLGCSFYFLLTGQVPFPGGSVIQKLDRHRWEMPISIDQLRPDTPPDVQAVLRRLLAKHPDDRFATPDELAAELQAILVRLEEPSIPAVPMTPDVPRGINPGVRSVWPTGFVGECRRFLGPGGYISGLTVTPDDRYLLACGLEGRIGIWTVETGEQLLLLEAHAKPVHYLSIAADARHFFSAGEDQMLRFWEIATGKLMWERPLPEDARYVMLVVPEQQLLLLTRDEDNGVTLRRWELEGGTEQARLVGHRASFSSLTVSADGKSVLAGARDGAIRCWDLTSGQERSCRESTGDAVFALTVTRDGRLAASGGSDRRIRMWDPSDGRSLGELGGHTASIRGLAFSADGRWLLSCGNDQTVRWWDVEARTERQRYEGHTDSVSGIALLADQRHCFSGSNDRTIRMWRLPGSSVTQRGS